jgi:hypothetical protein
MHKSVKGPLQFKSVLAGVNEARAEFLIFAELDQVRLEFLGTAVQPQIYQNFLKVLSRIRIH